MTKIVGVLKKEAMGVIKLYFMFCLIGLVWMGGVILTTGGRSPVGSFDKSLFLIPFVYTPLLCFGVLFCWCLPIGLCLQAIAKLWNSFERRVGAKKAEKVGTWIFCISFGILFGFCIYWISFATFGIVHGLWAYWTMA